MLEVAKKGSRARTFTSIILSDPPNSYEKGKAGSADCSPQSPLHYPDAFRNGSDFRKVTGRTHLPYVTECSQQGLGPHSAIKFICISVGKPEYSY